MYTVVWDNHEGNERNRHFETLEDAKLEAADLAERFDYVRILGANGRPVDL